MAKTIGCSLFWSFPLPKPPSLRTKTEISSLKIKQKKTIKQAQTKTTVIFGIIGKE